MIKTPDYLVTVELAERLKEIGFDKEVHFFFLYYEGHKILRKRGSKFGFITSDGCNPANVDNYNRIEGRTSIPTWFEVINWFENLDPKICIEVRKCDARKNESGKIDSFIEVVVTKRGKYKIDSDFVYFATVYSKDFFYGIGGNDETLKTYSNKKDILVAAINKAIDYYKDKKQ